MAAYRQYPRQPGVLSVTDAAIVAKVTGGGWQRGAPVKAAEGKGTETGREAVPVSSTSNDHS